MKMAARETSQRITIKTLTGKTFDFPTSNKTRKIFDVKNWLSDNHGIPTNYQELFDQVSGKKMDDTEIISDTTNTTLNLVIKPMHKYELVVYSYGVSKQISAAGAWSVLYLYKTLAEMFNYPCDLIEIDVTENDGTVRRLYSFSGKTLSTENIDATCTLNVYRMLKVLVTVHRLCRTVRIDNKDKTVKDLIKKLCKEFKFDSKPKARRRKGYLRVIIPSKTLIVDVLNFERLQVSCR